MADDPSWYILSYDLAVQQAYELLQGLPYGLKDLHAGLSDNLTPIQQRIYKAIHGLITNYPASFVEWAHELAEAPSSGAPGARSGRAEMYAYVNPELKFAAWCERELIRCEAEERKFIKQELARAVKPVRGHTRVAQRAAASPYPMPAGDSEHYHHKPVHSPRVAFGEAAATPPRTGPSFSQRVMARVDSAASTSSSSTLFSGGETDTICPTPLVSPQDISDSTSDVDMDFVQCSIEADPEPDDTPIEASRTSWKPTQPPPIHERAVYVIPPNSYQGAFDHQDVHFSVQWELERLMRKKACTVKWSDMLREDVDLLRGTAIEVMPRLPDFLRRLATRKLSDIASTSRRDVPTKNMAMYAEMDQEEDSIRRGDLSGLGNDSPDWSYGGKIIYSVTVQPVKQGLDTTPVQFVQPNLSSTGSIASQAEFGNVALVKTGKRSTAFAMTLQPPEMPGKSFRLARRYGSRRILHFKFKDFKDAQEKSAILQLFIGRIFVLFGRTYRALWAPNDKQAIFAVETSDCASPVISPRKPRDGTGPPSFTEIISAFNSLQAKPGQAMAKWAARPQLLFSDSLPVATVEPRAIACVEDIITSEARIKGSTSTEQTLTDGCGLMSEALAQRIGTKLCIPRPHVVQIRLGGSKGLLTLMSAEQQAQYEGKEVVLRDSMVKALPDPRYAEEPSLFVVDLLHTDKLRVGTTLSSEAIIAMGHNGVPIETFVRLSDEGLETLRDAFIPEPINGETEEDMMNRIITACYRQGGVGAEMKKRQCLAAGGSTRIAGLSWFDQFQDDTSVGESSEDGPDDDPIERYGICPYSGQSESMAESLMQALAAGFDPRQSCFPAIKLRRLAATLADAMKRRFKIPVERSLSAFMVPDSQGILAPDEIFVSFSGNGPLDPVTGCPMSHISGDVIAYRSPCKLPTDVRKFKAIWRPELAHLKNCIVLSASSELCKRSPGSYLSGGDYDGDTLSIFWDERLVEGFSNAADSYAEVPPEFEAQNFHKEVIKVAEFTNVLQQLPPEEQQDDEYIIANLQEFLLAAVGDDHLTKKYSDMHGNIVYERGFGDEQSVRLGRMFCHVLDAMKSGLKVKPEVLTADSTTYSRSLGWRNFKKNKPEGPNDARSARRPKKLGQFVMDVLMESGIAKANSIMSSFPDAPLVRSLEDHRCLSRLWLNAKAQSISRPELVDLAAQIAKVEAHVEACTKVWDAVQSRTLAGGANVEECYEALVARGTRIPTSSRKYDSSSADQKKADDLLRIRQRRELARIWREKLGVDDVPLLTHFGDLESLRRIKVSCAACQEPYAHRQTFVFNVDFTTVCAMKAETRDDHRMTAVGSVSRILKPSYKGIE